MTVRQASRGLDARDAKRWQAVAILVLGACALAFTPIFMRLSGVDPVAAGFWRLGMAIPFLLLLAVMVRPDADILRPPPRLLWAAAVFFALDLAFWHWGVRLTSVANATTLGNLSQVFVVIGAWLLFQERPRALFLAGVGLALGGVALMALAKDGAGGVDPLRGDTFAIVGAVWYGAYILTVCRLRDGLSATAVMLWTSLIGAPLLLLGALAMGETILPSSPAGWAACVGLGFVHFVGQGAIAWALGRLPAATASVVILLQPVMSAIMAVFLFSEPIGLWQAVGGVLALAGIVAAQLSSARPSKESVSPVTL